MTVDIEGDIKPSSDFNLLISSFAGLQSENTSLKVENVDITGMYVN